jgi:hypothetical protein
MTAIDNAHPAPPNAASGGAPLGSPPASQLLGRPLHSGVVGKALSYLNIVILFFLRSSMKTLSLFCPQ